MKIFPAPEGTPSLAAILSLWMRAVAHAAEHYGTLVIYYRLNNLVPPASRGN